MAMCLGALSWITGKGPDPSASTDQALILALRWLLVPALCLWAGIQFAAFWRFTHRDDNPGNPETTSHALDIALRYNRNTLEQCFLAGVAWLALAAAFPGWSVTAVPVLAILFGLGRTTFWLGYLWAPWARSFGFVLTFLPTVAVLLMLAFSGLQQL